MPLPLWRLIAGISGFMGIAMGAVAAHAIADAHLAALAEKASFYQLIHSLLLLWLSDKQGKSFGLARWCVLAGILLFCGTLYLKGLFAWTAATKFAPAGGVSLMAGWLLTALAAFRNK